MELNQKREAWECNRPDAAVHRFHKVAIGATAARDLPDGRRGWLRNRDENRS